MITQAWACWHKKRLCDNVHLHAWNAQLVMIGTTSSCIDALMEQVTYLKSLHWTTMCKFIHGLTQQHRSSLLVALLQTHQNSPCSVIPIVLTCYTTLPTGKAGSSRVGDGGASWRLKALARAKNQATDASDPNYGRRVGDIVSEQWGSLAQLTAGLTDARAAHGKPVKCTTVLTETE